MAGELIGALRVSLGLDSAKFEDGLKKSRSRATSEFNAIQKSLSSLKTGLNGLAAGLSAGALVAAGKRALDYASSLGEVAQQLGVTTKDLQTYRYAATQVGISQDEMDKSLAKLTRTIGEAKAGSGAQATVFRELGVAVQDASGRVYTAGEVIPKLADALSKVKDPATRARLEVELFGKAGQKLDTLLAGGGTAVDELTAAAEKLGVVLSSDQIQRADDTADKLAAIKQILEAKIAGAVSDNISTIMALANAFGYLAEKAGQGGQNFSNYRNLRGLMLAGNKASAATLLSTASGRHDLRADIANKQAENSRKRASGQGDPKQLDAQFKNLVRMQNAVTKADRAAERIAAAQASRPSTPGSLSTVTPSGGKPRGRTGPSASDRAENFKQELYDLQNEELGLQQNITADVRDRARMEHERIGTEKAAYDFDIDTKVKAGQLNVADAERLKLANDRNSALKDTSVNWQLDDELTQQEMSVRREGLQTQIDILQDQSRLARTAAQRRDIDLKILDHQIELEKLSLEAVVASHASTQAEKDIATARLAQLGNLRSGAAAGIGKSNAGPLAAYFDSLPQTADEVNEAFENIAANGIANMTDGLAQAGANMLKLKGFAGQLFNQLIADVIKLQIQSAAGGSGGLLGGLLKIGGSLLGGGSIGGISGKNNFTVGIGPAIDTSNLADPSKLTGLAAGGSFMAGGNPGTDRNVLSINGVPKVRVSANERIVVRRNAGNDNGNNIRVHVDSSPYFTATVRQEAAGVAAPMAMRAGIAGSADAQQTIMRRTARRIP